MNPAQLRAYLVELLDQHSGDISSHFQACRLEELAELHGEIADKIIETLESNP